MASDAIGLPADQVVAAECDAPKHRMERMNAAAEHFASSKDPYVSLAITDGLEGARDEYVSAVRACPSNLRWKVWLAGARMELSALDRQRTPAPPTGAETEAEAEAII